MEFSLAIAQFNQEVYQIILIGLVIAICIGLAQGLKVLEIQKLKQYAETIKEEIKQVRQQKREHALKLREEKETLKILKLEIGDDKL